MKVYILGAGVIGVATAYLLGRAGYEVVVIDQASHEASGASAANGAQLSYSYVDPFASPWTFRNLPKYLFGLDSAIRFGWSFQPGYLLWGLKFIANCRPDRFVQNFDARLKLATDSQEMFERIKSEIPGEELRSTGHGKIILAQTSNSLDQLKFTADQKRKAGFEVIAMSAEQCRNRFPELQNWTEKFFGGIYCPDDKTMDCQLFCRVLKHQAEKNFDVTFRFNEKVKALKQSKNQITKITTNKSIYECHTVIACLASHLDELLREHKIKSAIYPIQGYSLTLPVGEQPPEVSITDLKNKMVFANLGSKLRIAGFMDGNLQPRHNLTRCQQLLETAMRLAPEFADYSQEPNFWTEYRPMTPSGIPKIGPTKIKGLYLNAGHDSLGYTFALGSGKVIQQLLDQRQF